MNLSGKEREGIKMRRSETIGDPTTTRRQSSIALLQERFRQLQREKEMREEKELLMRMLDSKLFVNNIVPSATASCDQPLKYFYRPDIGGATPPHLSLSLCPSPGSGCSSCLRSVETVPMLVSSRSSSSHGNQSTWTGFSGKMTAEDLDVDTSLRL